MKCTSGGGGRRNFARIVGGHRVGGHRLGGHKVGDGKVVVDGFEIGARIETLICRLCKRNMGRLSCVPLLNIQNNLHNREWESF